MGPDEIIASHRDYYGSYHHHKETMAYGAATLYIGAATAVILEGRKMFETSNSQYVLPTLLFLSLIVGHAFVIWQLVNREIAANIVRAATTVLSRLAVQGNPALDMTPTSWGSVLLPRVLVDELSNSSNSGGFIGGARTATVLTVVATLGWSLLAILALAC